MQGVHCRAEDLITCCVHFTRYPIRPPVVPSRSCRHLRTKGVIHEFRA
jgi:hypothetical protein